jgi:pyrimidine-nucleoside phosphorylase
MDIVELLVRKRDGGELAPDEISWLITAYTRQEIPDYQVSAFLMAALLRGLSPAESAALTDAMIQSGEVLDLSYIAGTKVDKHSTGGVGDKVSIALAPIVAAAGVLVPMISGRGLGHTGGTLDKLESIPGFRTDLTIREYQDQLADIGLVMIGQTDEIAPADRKLYALRDVTGTVEYIPFIASSIMSKKLAEGIDALVLDVKWGRGAFMREEADARALAETLVRIGEDHGKATVAWLTDMNNPLGFAIGNWPETREAIRCLHGDFVPEVSDLVEVLAGEMICLGGKADTPTEGRRIAKRLVDSGAALRKFVELVERQGGDPRVVEEPDRRAEAGPGHEVTAPGGLSGRVSGIDPYALGRVAVSLGAGRESVADAVDPLAGIVLLKKPGDDVQPSEPVARLYTRRSARIDEAVKTIREAFTTGNEPLPPLLVDRYQGGRWMGDSRLR